MGICEDVTNINPSQVYSRLTMLLKLMYVSELLHFWTLSIVRYSTKTREHNVSKTCPGTFTLS
jgi:hypothetical protein